MREMLWNRFPIGIPRAKEAGEVSKKSRNGQENTRLILLCKDIPLIRSNTVQ
jgi:hypothetical protein